MNPGSPESHRRLAQIIVGQAPLETVSDAQWAQLVPLAVQQGLGPMLYWVLEQVGMEINGTLWALLERAARGSAAHHAVLAAEQKRLDGALAQAGIPAIWLKGIALASTVYPEPWCRPMEDLDVLVPYEQRAEAVQVAEDLGYRRSGSDYLALLRAPESVQNHDQLRGGAGGAVMLEIHFRLLGVDGIRLLPPAQLARFWDQTRRLEGSGLAGMALKPEAHLLYLCAHALLQHGEAYLNLLRLLDLHLLVTKSELDWGQVAGQAYDLGWVYAVQRGLRLAAELFRTPLPEHAWQGLKVYPGREASQAIAARLQQRTARWEEWKTLFRSQSNAQRLHLVWATLFPPQAYMRELYALPTSSGVLPYYLFRWFDGGREVARSMVAGWKRRRMEGPWSSSGPPPDEVRELE